MSAVKCIGERGRGQASVVPGTPGPRSTRRVLVITDNPGTPDVLRQSFSRIRDSYRLSFVSTHADGLAAIAEQADDAYLVDDVVGGRTGLGLIRRAKAIGCEAPLILLVDRRDTTFDVAAIKAGAADFLLKGEPDPVVIDRTVRYAIARAASVRQMTRDLATGKRAERENATELVHAQELSRAKDDFLSVVSHELRSPLTAMLGWSSLLRSRDFSAPLLAKGLEAIEMSARAQRELIDDLLDVSRIITGKLRIEMSPVDFSAIVEAAVEAARPAAEEKGLSLHAELGGIRCPIAGDPGRLHQVVGNLLSNAVKFTPTGGSIDVVLTRVGACARLVVRDTGIGIPGDLLPHVFERLKQADEAMTAGHGGMGLGLAIVRELVDLHGGALQATSAGAHKGATFTVELPLDPARRNESETVRALPDHQLDKAQAAPLDDISVLVVEPEPLTREMLKTGLEADGARVVEAASVPQALGVLRDDRLDVVVTDIGMPGEDGYSLIRKLRRSPDERLRRLPAIAVTAFARLEHRRRALSEGFQFYLAKPVDPSSVTAAVRRVIRRFQPPPTVN